MSNISIRILYVEGNVDRTIGGSYFSLLYLVSRLDRNRFHPIVVFLTDNELIERFHAYGIRTIVRRPSTPFALAGRLGRGISKALNFCLGWILEPLRLAVLLRRERISLVHLNNSIIKNHSWMLAAWITRIPCVTHERGVNPYFLPRARLLAKTLGAIICISEAVRANFVSLRMGQLPIVTIYNGLDAAEMRVTRSAEAIRREFGLDRGSRLIGMIGNIRSWKGQDIVVRAMSLLRDEFPKAVCLLIGATSSDEKEYQLSLSRLVVDLGLQGRVIIAGYRRDVANYVNALEIQVHASNAPEPFGRVLLEAMALRKPLVASRHGAVPEIVIHGETGLLFTPGQANSLASCLRTLLVNPPEAAAMGRAGYERLISNFSVERGAREVERLYEQLLRD